ncbi:MAG: hypothetical protein ABI828_06195 [Actinomycetota bacterium]
MLSVLPAPAGAASAGSSGGTIVDTHGQDIFVNSIARIGIA